MKIQRIAAVLFAGGFITCGTTAYGKDPSKATGQKLETKAPVIYQLCLPGEGGKLTCKSMDQAKFCLEGRECQPLAEAVICAPSQDGKGQTCMKIGELIAARPLAATPSAATVDFEAADRQPVSGQDQLEPEKVKPAAPSPAPTKRMEEGHDEELDELMK